ncbi:MAG: TerC family protein [Nitrospirae bacterium]|nr:TerC family protein [Nitrospirota bacterium]
MLDLGSFGHISFDLAFLSALLSIVLINLILSGDNAVVIALAVRSLHKNQRKWGIILGSGFAVLLRVGLTFFAAKLLSIPFLKFLGGLLIAWIAVKLFSEGTSEKELGEASNIMQAVKTICIADLVMSVDNILAIAGASKGNMFLLLFGLGSSIPLVVGTSTLLSMLMDKYPIIVYVGAAILGRVAGEMIMTDPVIVSFLKPGEVLRYVVEIAFAIAVIVIGKLLVKRENRKMEKLSLLHGSGNEGG